MAIPTATGMVLAPSRKSTVQIHSVPGDSGRYHNTGPMAKTAQKTTPEKANHLRCWRSTPRARRKRTTNEIPPATATASVIKRSTIPSVPRALCNADGPYGIMHRMNAYYRRPQKADSRSPPPGHDQERGRSHLLGEPFVGQALRQAS